MASTKHRWALLATTIAASAAVAACGSSSGSSSDGGGSSGGTATITVGIPTDDASYAPLYLAEDRDLFAKYHVKVKPVVFKGGADLAKRSPAAPSTSRSARSRRCCWRSSSTRR